MLQASRLIPQGRGLATPLVQRAARLELDWDTRQKSRFDTVASDERHVGVFLPPGRGLRGGDVLLTQDGSLLRVVAAAQPVLRVTACPDLPTQKQAFDLMRGAFHLCNRHVPIELRADHLKIEPDPVLADLLRGMDLTVVEARDAFEPGACPRGEHGVGADDIAAPRASEGRDHHPGLPVFV